MKLHRDSGLLLVILICVLAFAGILVSSWGIYRYAARGMNRNLDQRIRDTCTQAAHAAQQSAHEPEILQQHLEFMRLSAKLEKLMVFDRGRNSLGDANPNVRLGKHYTFLELPPDVTDEVLAGREFLDRRSEVETFSDSVVFRAVGIPLRVRDEVVGGAYAQAGVDFESELALLHRNWITATGLAAGVSLLLIGIFVVLFRRNRAMNLLMQRQSRMAMIHQLSAGIAHDIKNPLTVIMNATEMMDREHDTDGRLLELMRDASRQVLDITEQLLGTGRMSEPVELELAGFVQDACRPFLPVARGKGVKIQYALDGEGTVRASPTPLRMAISNIVNNAVQALDEGGKVHLSLRRDKDLIGIAISDNGPGIPAQMRRRIFDPLVTSKKEGTGLGLPVARQLIEDMMGTIRLESEPDVGTTFTIWLPLVRTDHGKDSDR